MQGLDTCLRARARLNGRLGVLMHVLWALLLTTRTLAPPMLPLVCGLTFLMLAKEVHPGEARPYIGASWRILLCGACWAFGMALWTAVGWSPQQYRQQA